MKTFSKFLFAALIAFGIQACGGGDKANNSEGDTTQTTQDTAANTENKTPEKKTGENSTKTADDTTDGNKTETRNTDKEKLLVGVWGDKPNMSQFTFKEDGTFEEITPVPVITGTYKVIGNVLMIEGIKKMDGAEDENYKDQYDIEQLDSKKMIKLKKGELVRVFRYDEKL
ncbi:hypothetical protein [uncultured Microscilla sp.]|uniref:hypothetical protein n=1 Tax=uncultured Microscilla sp. TaxID=432653 RepID=UPI002612E6F0|nr:hypothetical protein [uncultured Microscilla sp.]